MSRKSTLENLIQIKQALAAKYARLAAESGSKPARVRLHRKSEAYRHQAINLSRL